MKIAASNPPVTLLKKQYLMGVGLDTYFGDVQSSENSVWDSPAYHLFYAWNLEQIAPEADWRQKAKTGHKQWKEREDWSVLFWR